MDDVALNKLESIERAVARVREVHAGDHARLEDPTLQDSVVLNIQRACEASIDLAMHLVRRERLGVPQTSREAFDLLEKSAELPTALAERMGKMVGFRNVAIHDYQKLSLPILQAIIDRHLDDLLAFGRWALERAGHEAPDS